MYGLGGCILASYAIFSDVRATRRYWLPVAVLSAAGNQRLYAAFRVAVWLPAGFQQVSRARALCHSGGSVVRDARGYRTRPVIAPSRCTYVW